MYKRNKRCLIYLELFGIIDFLWKLTEKELTPFSILNEEKLQYY
jgi:hypothetical protein